MKNAISTILLSAVIGLVAGAAGAFLVLRADTGLMPAANVGGTTAQEEEVADTTPPATDTASLRAALMEDPAMIRDALIELQRREQEAQAAGAKERIAGNADAIFNSPDDHVAGNPDGDVTVVEFFDYNCPYCQRAHQDMKALIDNDPDVRFVLKEFPILGPESMQLARLAVAADKQDRYMDFHNALFEAEGKLDGRRGLQIAEELGLDVEKLEADANSEEVTEIITASLQLGQSIGINGTPGYVIGEEVVPGAIGAEGLAGMIADERER